MNNLVIVGNGFDLAHGLKTSYIDFMKYIIDSKYNDKNLYNDLLEYGNENFNYEQLLNKIKSNTGLSIGFKWSNRFFYLMLTNVAHQNWCDVEKLYYQNLISPNAGDPKVLNREFDMVKKYLEDYLILEKNNFEQIPCYNSLFSSLKNAENTLILNFNYTDTVLKYDSVNSGLKIVNIHGELNSEKNPIIFGFAADDTQSRILIDKDNKEYMRNIKKHCYKRTSNQNKLIDYLEKIDKIDVLILGHSCGISDKLILNQIFNHKNINSIRVFFHQTHEAYFETQVNIDRIMNDVDNFSKLVNFEESFKMPQKLDDGKNITDFVSYINGLLSKQKSKRTGYIF